MVHLKWPVGISIIQLSASVLAAVTAFTKSWGFIPDQSLYFGLTDLSPNTDDVINLLMAVLGIGLVVSLPCCILEFCAGLGCNILLCCVSGLMALLAFAAMIHGIVVLSNAIYFQYSWSFGLGWLTVIIAVASGVLSFFTREKETKETGIPAALPVQGATQQNIAVISENIGQSFP